MNLLGDLSGKSAVDVACGDGYYTRRLRAHGAARVLGIDLSERMIELARAQEREHRLGIEYEVGDGRDLRLPTHPDIVVAAYLLNYARDRAELGAMCASIARCLRPGGRFVTVNQNPALDFRSAPSYRPYGFETTTGASGARARRSPGPSISRTGPSPSRTTISRRRPTRRPSGPRDSGRFAGIRRSFRRRARPPSDARSGTPCSTTRRSPFSNARNDGPSE